VFTTTVDTDEIQLLIADLASEDWRTRQEARHSLVRLGSRAVAPLIKALGESNNSYWALRWEAAKALGEIADPVAAPALLRALEDERDGIRWLAAEGLIAMGRGGLLPLLEALVHRSDSGRLRAGAHHVLRQWVERDPQGIIIPVLKALEDIEPVIQVPPAAQAALDALTGAKKA